LNQEDIVEQKERADDTLLAFETEEKLNFEKKLIKAVLDNTNNIVIVRKNSTPVLTNKKFSEILPFDSLEEFSQKHSCICELFIKEEGYYHTEGKQWIDESAGKNLKVVLYDNDAQKRYFNFYIKHFVFGGDRYTIFTLSDISEVEKNRKEALEAKRLKEIFLASMSHEIRTPLNAIAGFTALLSDTNPTEKQKEYLQYIQTSSDFLMGIINEILDFSKIESHKVEFEIANNNLYNTVISTYKILYPLARQKGVELKLTIETDAECYQFDEVKLRQILTNLLSNAIKFTQKGVVELRVEKDLTFRVIDSGIGIPQEKLHIIFEPFRQADASISRKYGGTGLGLPIISKLLEMMGSKLQVKSSEGKGSEFYFQLALPCCKEQFLQEKVAAVSVNSEKISRFLAPFTEIKSKAPIKIRSKNGALFVNEYKIAPSVNILYHLYHYLYHMDDKTICSYKKYNAKILVAEDNEFNRILIQEFLGKLDIEPDFAKDGKEVVSKAEDEYDMILMDINMPKLNGIEAAKCIKKFSQVSIVALSAYATKEESLEIRECMDDFIPKPINMVDIIRIFDKYLLSYPEKLQREYRIDAKKTDELIALFVTNTEGLLKSLKEALRKRNYEEMHALFHQLAGSSASMRLSHIEKEARRGMRHAYKEEKYRYKKILKKIKKSIAELA